MKQEYVNATLDIIILDGNDIISTSDCEYDGYQPPCDTELPF